MGVEGLFVCLSSIKVKFDQSLTAAHGSGFSCGPRGRLFCFVPARRQAKGGNYLTRGRPSVSHSLKDVSSFARHCRWETEAKRGEGERH